MLTTNDPAPIARVVARLGFVQLVEEVFDVGAGPYVRGARARDTEFRGQRTSLGVGDFSNARDLRSGEEVAFAEGFVE